MSHFRQWAPKNADRHILRRGYITKSQCNDAIKKREPNNKNLDRSGRARERAIIFSYRNPHTVETVFDGFEIRLHKIVGVLDQPTINAIHDAVFPNLGALP